LAIKERNGLKIIKPFSGDLPTYSALGILTMGKSFRNNTGKHVVSVRITDIEKKLLEDLARGLGVNTSSLLRKSLNLILEESWGNREIQFQSLIPDAPFQRKR